jgi:hypothetical protein
MSRLATNHGATTEAIAALQQALAAGEDTTSVVTTAVVEAAFTLRRAIAWLDFAMQVPHPGVDWHNVAVLGTRGLTITRALTGPRK